MIKFKFSIQVLCPENTSTSIELEMANVIDWARENKMTVNLLKTVELVFRRPNISNDLYHLLCPMSKGLVQPSC